MEELNAYRKIMTELPQGVLEAEAEAEKNDRISAGLTDGKVSGMSASDKTAIFVRASGEKTGTVYTQNLEADPGAVLLEALENSKYVQAEQPEIMNRDAKSETPPLEHAELEVLLKKAQELESEVKRLVPDASHVEIMVTENLRTVGIVNSLELDKTYTKRIAEASLLVTVEKEVHRSLALETSAGSVADIRPEYFTGKIKQWCGWPVSRSSLPRTMPIEAVLDAGVICNILLTAWLMFSGDQHKSKNTPFYGRLEEKLFSPLVTLSDIPGAAENGYGREFDCEGSICRRVDVVKNGVFKKLMHNLSTAAHFGCETTGNAGRDVNLISDQTDVRVIPSHFFLCSGKSDKTELLSRLKDGMYICECYDMFHCLNTTSGDFTIPCIGIRYQDGKPTGMAEGMTMNGNIEDLLRDVEMVANDRATVSMVMSKSFEVSASSVYVRRLSLTM